MWLNYLREGCIIHNCFKIHRHFFLSSCTVAAYWEKREATPICASRVECCGDGTVRTAVAKEEIKTPFFYQENEKESFHNFTSSSSIPYTNISIMKIANLFPAFACLLVLLPAPVMGRTELSCCNTAECNDDCRPVTSPERCEKLFGTDVKRSLPFACTNVICCEEPDCGGRCEEDIHTEGKCTDPLTGEFRVVWKPGYVDDDGVKTNKAPLKYVCPGTYQYATCASCLLYPPLLGSHLTSHTTRTLT